MSNYDFELYKNINYYTIVENFPYNQKRSFFCKGYLDNLNLYVGIKLFNKKFLSRDHWYREVYFLEKLRGCENIVQIYTSFHDKKYYYIIMECGVGDIKQYDIKENFDVFNQLCKGIKDCHDNYITHGDIKHENIIIFEDGKIKLCDFGHSFLYGQHIEGIGSLNFKSPEVIDNEIVDYKCDIWALGVILYEIFTGKMLFNNINQIKKFNIKSLEKRLSKDRYECISLFLEKNPYERVSIDDII
jgi:serine/threonine protein kinase